MSEEGVKNENSTIWVPSKLKERLDQLKVHKNQAYHEIITMLLDEYEN